MKLEQVIHFKCLRTIIDKVTFETNTDYIFSISPQETEEFQHQ